MSSLISSFVKNPKNVTFDGEDSDEFILYIIRKSFVTNMDWVFIVAVMAYVPFLAGSFYETLNPSEATIISASFAFVLTVSWYVFTLGFLLMNATNWFFNVYIITNKRIVDIDFHGLLYKNISEAPLKNVEDVTSNISGTLPVIFNYGNVYVQTAAERREFEFENVDTPAKIRDIISDLVTGSKKHGNWKQI